MSHLGLLGNVKQPKNIITEGIAKTASITLQEPVLSNAELVKKTKNKPIVIINWYKAIKAPLNSFGAISDRYKGAINEAIPTAIPKINLELIKIW